MSALDEMHGNGSSRNRYSYLKTNLLKNCKAQWLLPSLNLTQQSHFIIGEAKLALQRYQCYVILVMDEFRFILYFLAGRRGVENCFGGDIGEGDILMHSCRGGGHIDAFIEGDIVMHSQLTSF